MVTKSYYTETTLNSIEFKKGDLTPIYQAINSQQLNFSGYWQFVFDREPKVETELSSIWYVYFSKGKVTFSSSQAICFTNTLEVLTNYLPTLRNLEAKHKIKIDQLKMLSKNDNSNILSSLKLLIKLSLDTKLINYQQIVEAIKIHILNDFEQYLFTRSGKINIVADKTVDIHKPIVGFDLDNILDTIKEREIQWQKLQKIVLSWDIQLSCNEQNPRWNNLPTTQQQKIKQLVDSGDTLKQIRYNLGKDRLKIAQSFAQLIEKQLVIFGANNKTNNLDSSNKDFIATNNQSNSPVQAQIVIIDDSLALLKQFEKIVTNWGYTARCCNDALKAVDFLLKSPPQIIFLDVNMPHLSGFELIKQIRIQPKLSSIPLVILTAENTIMNNYRAKWSKSIFLTKPLHKDDVNNFRSDLRNLLEKMLNYSNK